MGNCGNCKGNCGGCSGCTGCGGAMELSEGEFAMVRTLGQIPFLPVARNMGDLNPVFPENPTGEFSLLLQCLEKKGLVSLDYHLGMKGYSHPDYDRYPIRGSMALTERGQKVLELVEYHGITE